MIRNASNITKSVDTRCGSREAARIIICPVVAVKDVEYHWTNVDRSLVFFSSGMIDRVTGIDEVRSQLRINEILKVGNRFGNVYSLILCEISV